MADGPIPKRSDQRVRRNIDAVPVEKVTAIGTVVVPPLALEDFGVTKPHPFVVGYYESLKDSGQSKFYEPSDWHTARLVMFTIHDMLVPRTQGDDKDLKVRISAVKLQVINQMLSTLMVTEGDRRRMRLEVERAPKATDGAQVLSIADHFHNQLTAGQRQTT